MAIIKHFDKPNARLVSAAAMDALASVAKQYGVTLSRGGGTFSSTEFSFKISFTAASKDGKPQNPFAAKFALYASMYGLKESDLGRKVQGSDGAVYTLVGLNPKAPRFPLVVRNANGKEFRMTAEALKLKVTGKKPNGAAAAIHFECCWECGTRHNASELIDCKLCDYRICGKKKSCTMAQHCADEHKPKATGR